MNLNAIKIKVLKVLEERNLILYDFLEEKIGNEKILTILIDNSIDHQELEKVHMEVLSMIEDDMDDDYFLQLSTVGIEKELRNLEEVKNEIGSYVYLESNNFEGNATLNNVTDDELEISFFIKGRPKKLTIKYAEVRFIRQAVKV